MTPKRNNPACSQRGVEIGNECAHEADIKVLKERVRELELVVKQLNDVLDEKSKENHHQETMLGPSPPLMVGPEDMTIETREDAFGAKILSPPPVNENTSLSLMDSIGTCSNIYSPDHN